MKYLILGSSGQIGEGLMEFVSNAGHEAIEFDIVRSPNEDLRIPNNPLLDKAVQDADFVFFLAFDVGGAKYLKKYQDSYEFITNNMKLMSNVFDTLKKYNKPFIFASSQMSSMSFSNYGVLKSMGEKITNQLPNGRVAKFWNVYGFERDFEKSHVITDLILKADRLGKVELMTNGLEERQLLHVEDCSRCLVTLSEKFEEIEKDQPLHVSSFKWSTILEVAEYISKAFDGAVVVPADKHDEVQHAMRVEPSPFIKKYWQPRIELKDGIDAIIKKMREEKTIK